MPSGNLTIANGAVKLETNCYRRPEEANGSSQWWSDDSVFFFDGRRFRRCGQDTFSSSNGGLLVVTNGDTNNGGCFKASGTLTVTRMLRFCSRDIYLARDDIGSVEIKNGTVTLSGSLGHRLAMRASGIVNLNGGTLVVTNAAHWSLVGASKWHLTYIEWIVSRAPYSCRPSFGSACHRTINGGTDETKRQSVT